MELLLKHEMIHVNDLLPVKSELPLDSVGRRRGTPLRSFSFFGGRPVLLRPRKKKGMIIRLHNLIIYLPTVMDPRHTKKKRERERHRRTFYFYQKQGPSPEVALLLVSSLNSPSQEESLVLLRILAHFFLVF